MSRIPYSKRLLGGLLLPLMAALALAAVLTLRPDLGVSELAALGLGAIVGVIVAILVHARLQAPLHELRAHAQNLLGGGSTADRDEIAVLRASLHSLSHRTEKQVGTLEAERKHLLAIVSSMSEGVLVVDRGGRAVLVNPYWTELFGLADDMSGASPIELTRQTRLERLITRTLETGVGGQEEIDLDLPRVRTIVVTCSALSDRSGAVAVARDITPFLRLAEIRRDFVGNVSHELKTPLSAIRGLAETLRDGALEDPTAADRFLVRILRQCARLEALLSDLLTLSRLEHPAAASEKRPVDLGTVIHEAAEVLTAMSRQKQVDLRLDLEQADTIPADREVLDRLVLNLLENAIKYNRPGGRVEARLRQGDGEVVFEVTDTGIGIPSDSLDRLFERFYRVDKGRSREEGGTGLGLAIVKHAAQLHGGRVEVESHLGRGSLFRVRFPSTASTPMPATPSASALTNPD